MIQNLEQIRAKHAFEAKENCKKEDGDALSGYPSLVINNGLIATLAFSIEKKGQHKAVADAIAIHFERLPDTFGNLLKENEATAQGLLKALQNSDAIHLRRCTDEALAYLSYLKRFVRSAS